MDTENTQGSVEYLDILIWMETATEEEISGAYWLATGSIRIDLERGIQALMASDRPALAYIFPELVVSPIQLSDLPASFPHIGESLERLQTSLLRREIQPNYQLRGFGELAAQLNELKHQGRLSSAQSSLLFNELTLLKKGNVYE